MVWLTTEPFPTWQKFWKLSKNGSVGIICFSLTKITTYVRNSMSHAIEEEGIGAGSAYPSHWIPFEDMWQRIKVCYIQGG